MSRYNAAAMNRQRRKGGTGPTGWGRGTPAVLSLWILVAALWGGPALASTDRYRVELIVFRNVGTPAEPVEVDRPRQFLEAYGLDEAAAPPVPVRLDKQDGAFSNIWSRLDRLAEYEPLLRLTYEQSMYDFHPPVRVHDEVVMAQVPYFPGNVVYLDTVNMSGGWFDDYLASLYRLDGTLRLRRSRFLHIDLDLEYRLEGDAWERVFPPLLPTALPEGFEWVTEPVPSAPSAANGPAIAREGSDPGALADATVVATNNDNGTAGGPSVEPFRVHRLAQSRQIRTNTLQYFDSAFLGAIVRVTPIADEAP